MQLIHNVFLMSILKYKPCGYHANIGVDLRRVTEKVHTLFQQLWCVCFLRIKGLKILSTFPCLNDNYVQASDFVDPRTKYEFWHVHCRLM